MPKQVLNLFTYFLCIVLSLSMEVYCLDKSKSLLDGDIIFQESLSDQSKAIQLAAKSKYSHMGIIFIKDNQYFVFEAVQPVKLTPLKDWINAGANHHYVVKRLTG